MFKFILLFIGLAFCQIGVAKNFSTENSSLCHPDVDPKLPQYIIGYGSLIQNQSRNKTYAHAGHAIPVMVYGYQRGWFQQGDLTSLSTTFLGVKPDSSSKFNGVVFALPNEAVAFYDERETGYCRSLVMPKAIQILTQTLTPRGQYWIYVTQPNRFAKPSKKFPMIQSYVDTFLSGCLAIEQDYHLPNFTTLCIDTTKHWSPHWVNDRIYPRRPLIYQPEATQIDQHLAAKLPKIFQQIKPE